MRYKKAPVGRGLAPAVVRENKEKGLLPKQQSLKLRCLKLPIDSELRDRQLILLNAIDFLRKGNAVSGVQNNSFNFRRNILFHFQFLLLIKLRET
jgi:hypothetical protein